ncbi:MAG: RagB/SusD family nutrient uptake outer membrane protein [Bacteroidales bacterium]|nr:MAG: RagB/SusD family nutrient uptake outer membrane protein [Bacteroidales bacterium]
MRTIKYILIGMIIILMSCSEDFVELTNPNALTSGSFWKTEEDFVLGVNAIYQAMIYDGTYMRFFPWIMDIRADDVESVTPGYFPEDVANYIVDAANIAYSFPWEHHYIGVWRSNQVLVNIEGVEFEDEELKQRLIGEAKFMRAHFYFNLLNLFRNVVLYTTLAESTDDYYIPQSPPDDVWAQVISDFTDAIDGLWLKEDPRNEMGRATKAAAAAFLAKSYMINHRFSEAAPVLKDIIDGKYGTYSLVENYRHNITEENENNSESIFEIQYHYDPADGLSVQGWIGDPQPNWLKTCGYNKTCAPQPHGWGDLAPSVWIWNEFQEEKTVDGENDPRMEASLYFPHDDDTTYTVYGNPASHIYEMGWANPDVVPDSFYVFIRKHITEDHDLDNDWFSGINRRVFRYADVLLLYAECLNEAGQTAEAYQYIQQVRNRANLPDLNTVRPNMTQEEMRDQLDHERALELCFEGWRYVDLVRWGWFQDEAKLQILIQRDPEYLNYYNPDEGLWLQGREYMAIPPTEIERTNGIVKQNPGWN